MTDINQDNCDHSNGEYLKDGYVYFCCFDCGKQIDKDRYKTVEEAEAAAQWWLDHEDGEGND